MLMFLFITSIIAAFIGGMIAYSLMLDFLEKTCGSPEPIYPKIKRALGDDSNN